MFTHPIVHIELSAKDLKVAGAFYEKLLDGRSSTFRK
jgi:predicted enzyme related to lactoylglutathione lyase